MIKNTDIRRYIDQMMAALNEADDGMPWDWYTNIGDECNQSTVYSIKDPHHIFQFATIRGKKPDKVANYISLVNPTAMRSVMYMLLQIEDRAAALQAENEGLKEKLKAYTGDDTNGGSNDIAS